MQHQVSEWESFRLQAIKATEELLTSQCAGTIKTLRRTKTRDGQEIELSFETILNKLKNNQYPSKKEWMEDCRLYSVSIQSSNSDRNTQIIFKYLFDKYKRLLRKYDVESIFGWWKIIEGFNFKLDHLLREPPENCKKYAELISSFPYKKELLTHKMVDYVAETGKKITNNVELMEIMSIISEDHNALTYDGDTLKVELRNLHQITLQKLYSFITTRYPQTPSS